MYTSGHVYSGPYVKKNMQNITALTNSNPLRYLSSFTLRIITAPSLLHKIVNISPRSTHPETHRRRSCSHLYSHQEGKCNQRRFSSRREAEIFIFSVPKSFCFCRILFCALSTWNTRPSDGFLYLIPAVYLLFLCCFPFFPAFRSEWFVLITGLHCIIYQDLCSLLITNILTRYLHVLSLSKRVLAVTLLISYIPSYFP